jgi:hypothetical protein
MSRWLPPMAAGLALVVFAALKLYSFHYATGDDNIYFYLAARGAEGAIPYRDFFFGHPPLHLLPGVLVFKLTGGFTLAAGRAIPMLATAIAGLFLYRIGRHRGPLEGVLACSLFLFSFDVLRISSHFVGASLSAMWVAIALERLCHHRDAQAALAFALGTFTLLSAAPAGLAVALVLLAADPKRALRFGAVGLAVFAALNLVCATTFGSVFFDQVYLYHLKKEAVPGDAAIVFATVVRFNTWLFFGALAGAAALLARLGESSRRRAPEPQPATAAPSVLGIRSALNEQLPLVAAAAAALASGVFLATIARAFTYYFEVLFVCLAPLAAFGLAEILRLVARALGNRVAKTAINALLLGAIVAIGQLIHWLPSGSHDTSRTSHTWKGSSVAGLDAVVRPLFWRDHEIAGTPYLAWTSYLWHEAQGFDAAEPLAQQVREGSQESDTIFGDSTSAPLIALLAGRRVALDEVDTNVMRFGTGAMPIEDLLRRLEAAPPRLIVTQLDRGIYSIREFRSWLRQHYAPTSYFDSPSQKRSDVLWTRL